MLVDKFAINRMMVGYYDGILMESNVDRFYGILKKIRQQIILQQKHIVNRIVLIMKKFCDNFFNGILLVILLYKCENYLKIVFFL